MADLSSLIVSSIMPKLQEGVEKDMVPFLQKTMQSYEEKDVYAVYSPKEYVRRRYKDGLLDKRNIKADIEVRGNEILLKVRNEAQPTGDKERSLYGDSSTPLAAIINYGVTVSPKAPIYTRPRPFMDHFYDTLAESDCLVLKEIVNIMLSYI